jgi:HD-GYP domain-containing protein (c-di-GMP phosphodiesterase class II)
MKKQHTDILENLNRDKSLKKKLYAIHSTIKNMLPFIHRIGIAMYDDKADLLKTFLSNSDEESPLIHYESKLDEALSLKQIIETGKPRVLNDLSVLDKGIHEHTIKIKEQGYHASYTFPMYQDGAFVGFIFFNSYDKNCFSESTLDLLDIFSHLISALIIYEVSTIKSVLAALRTANEMVHYKDPETGSHLQRMARFSRIIAKELSVSGKYTFDDKYIEDIFNYAPLHDVGKIGIPDKILLKPGKLDDKEFETMKTHASMGRQVIDSIIRNFEFDSFGNIDILRNIAEYHHETLDGHGYPEGLSKEDIPVEARIIAVADIFDALTSKRPYKEAWSNADAFEMLREMANTKLDKDCVEALYKNQPEIEEIQTRFRENTV